MDALTPDLELRWRTEQAERHVAELKAALENMLGDGTGGEHIAERKSLPERQTESALTRSETREWWWRLTV